MNRLSHESSPYLLQHQHNPVHWFPWCEEAFEIAQREDKPILVSIGYAACHWCHVMERESFENQATADVMNTHFINIKVDREERPDIDHIFMNACQILTGAGGWPLHVFLTPERKPFSAGTYFPPKPGYGKPAWTQVLNYMHTIFKNERDKVEEQAERLAHHIVQVDQSFIHTMQIPETEPLFSEKELLQAVAGMQAQFDLEQGGFGQAPKFPGSMSLRFLFRYAWFTGNEKCLQHVHLSLQKMRNGGIYDHVGGGFSRYAVDRNWMIPHFEKMLYDNALLIQVYAEVYRATQEKIYAETLHEIIRFIENEMLLPEKLCIASYDADSEGVEGKFYTFTYDECKEALGDDAEWAAAYWQITPEGNWEHTNILHTTTDVYDYARQHKLHPEEFAAQVQKAKEIVYQFRKKRIPPLADHKCILSWNALMCSAIVEAFKATAHEPYRTLADDMLQAMLHYFVIPDSNGKMWHTVTSGTGKVDAVLDDYAGVIQALLDVHDITGKIHYVQKAEEILQHVNQHFAGPDAMYFFTAGYQTDIPLRAMEFYDNATPSGNSIMVHNAQRLFYITENAGYNQQADQMLANMKKSMLQYGTSFGNWLMAALTEWMPYHEIVITGNQANKFRDAIFRQYFPHAVYVTDVDGSAHFPITHNRFVTGQTTIYHCRNFTCQQPVTSVQDFVNQVTDL